MSYLDVKRARDLALVRSIHGSVAGDDEPRQTGTPDLDGGARASSLPMAHYDPRPGPILEPSDEPGWGPTYEIENGAALIFPELFGDD